MRKKGKQFFTSLICSSLRCCCFIGFFIICFLSCFRSVLIVCHSSDLVEKKSSQIWHSAPVPIGSLLWPSPDQSASCTPVLHHLISIKYVWYHSSSHSLPHCLCCLVLFHPVCLHLGDRSAVVFCLFVCFVRDQPQFQCHISLGCTNKPATLFCI